MNHIIENVKNLQFTELRTYIVAMMFITGNLLLPQLFHTVPGGGAAWLPIFFFTLIGSCMYGWRVGIITAIVSPLLNTLLFGMPDISVVAYIMLKSVILGCFAGAFFSKIKSFGILAIFAIVLGSQIIGSTLCGLIAGSITQALSIMSEGIPGMLLQIFGGYALIKYLSNK